MNSLTLLIQVMVDLFLLIATLVLWIQARRPKSEDPRLAAGLQELQSKIAVLEDLGDRTERQVQQLMTILENKLIDVQKKIEQADSMQGQISKSMEKSLEVAKIFQDKIPHEEIHERQNTIKFVKAAILANQGYKLSEISQQVDLPYGELEFIVKVNKTELSFDQSQLPDWILSEISETKFNLNDELEFLDTPLRSKPKVITNAGLTSADQQALHKLGEKFRQAQILVAQQRSVEEAFEPSAEQAMQKPEASSRVYQAQLPEAEVEAEPSSDHTQYQRRVSDTVQRLVDQKKKELEVQVAANLERGGEEPGQPYYLGQESKILKKGINLGIRPVVFPRIEVNKNRG